MEDPGSQILHAMNLLLSINQRRGRCCGTGGFGARASPEIRPAKGSGGSRGAWLFSAWCAPSPLRCFQGGRRRWRRDMLQLLQSRSLPVVSWAALPAVRDLASSIGKVPREMLIGQLSMAGPGDRLGDELASAIATTLLPLHRSLFAAGASVPNIKSLQHAFGWLGWFSGPSLLRWNFPMPPSSTSGGRPFQPCLMVRMRPAMVAICISGEVEDYSRT